MAEATPMMRQYLEIKEKHRDKILFFRLGDFYEMFRDDALEASTLLNLTLTQRQGEPMCGIPFHAATTYIRRLLEAGKCIALCEQITQPGEGKGLVQRGVVEILTPGTLVEDTYLGDTGENHTMVFHWHPLRSALVVADLSTGRLRATSFASSAWLSNLEREMARFRPRELLVGEEVLARLEGLDEFLGSVPACRVTALAPWHFEARPAYRRLLDHFGLLGLTAFSLDETSAEVIPAGVLLDYWAQNHPGRSLTHVDKLEVFQASEYLLIDPDSARSLEVVSNARDGGKAFTLLEVVDQTQTASGARLLRHWLQFPLRSVSRIRERQEMVSILTCDPALVEKLRKALAGILDLERLGARLALEKASPRDLLGVGNSLFQALQLAQVLEGHPEGAAFLEGWNVLDRDPLASEAEHIRAVLLEDPAVQINEGGLIRPGVSPELDELRHLRDHSQEVLESYLAEEQRTTGLSQLRLKHNRIIGYFFEISKAKGEVLPPHFQRRQSLLGTERFSTPRLRDLEVTLQGAEERIFALEKELFVTLRDRLKRQLPAFALVSQFTARLDVVVALSRVALRYQWTCPLVTDGHELDLQEARHPVVEASLGTAFIPNSAVFRETDTLFLLTGPNMAGKSTYLRQTALIVLLAQTGSFVPCSSATIGLVDRIYCRVGASDHLAKGESTFLVEMNETARILRGATPNSLVIMDEVGRGTGTRDGFSLAWAICEYLLQTVRAKTLFATHFHELTALEHPGLSNFSMAVDDDGREVVFLRKVIPGASDNSYGLHVARLAGVPSSVVDRASQILEALPAEQGLPGTHPVRQKQLDLFAPDPQPDQLKDALRAIDPDQLTPLQALTVLARLKEISLS